MVVFVIPAVSYRMILIIYVKERDNEMGDSIDSELIKRVWLINSAGKPYNEYFAKGHFLLCSYNLWIEG